MIVCLNLVLKIHPSPSKTTTPISYCVSIPQQILLIHGGDAWETHAEYIANLKAKEVTLEKLLLPDWKANLQNRFGVTAQVIMPRMPNSQNARYAEWKIYFEKIIPLLNDDLILIGHSLGGIFLAKVPIRRTYPQEN